MSIEGVGWAVLHAPYLRQLEAMGEGVLNRRARKKLKDLIAVHEIEEAAQLLHRAISELFEQDTLTAEEAEGLYDRLQFSAARMAMWREQRMKNAHDAEVEASWEKIGDDFFIVRFH